MLRGAVLGTAGIAAAALIGCDDDDDDDDDAAGTATASPTAAATGTGTATATAEPEEPDYVTRAREDGAPFAYNFPEPDLEPKRGGTFIQGIQSGHSPFDPITSAGATTESANAAIGDYLVGYNVGPTMSKFAIELNADNGLAQSWEVAPDGMTLTFDLREANFHNVAPTNGRAMVANDVKLAYERMFSGRQAGLLGTIESVDAPDDRTVVFNMRIPNPDILTVMGNRATPIYAPEPYDAGIQNTTPIGTGKLIFDPANTVADQVMAFVSNPEYWGGAPYMDGWNIVSLPDAAARLAAFRVGQIHHGLIQAQTPEQWKPIFDSVPGMSVTCDPILMGITIYAVNSNVAPFNDPRVRQALKLAMNVDKYISILYPNGAAAFPAFGWPFLFDEKPTADKFGAYWKHDPDEARKLLTAAGQEGLHIRHIGPSQFSGDTSSQDSLWIEDLQNVGVDVEFLNVEFSVFNAQYYGQQWKDPATAESDSLQGWSTASPTANGYFWENVHSKSSVAHFAVNDPEVDRLADAQLSELDPAARRDIQLELYDYMNDQAYFMDKIPTTYSTTYIRPEARYYRFNAPYIGLHAFWDWGYGFHKAWLSDELQESPSIFLEKSGML
jgi:peptide/nickel transport system substrate-binding protein